MEERFRAELLDAISPVMTKEQIEKVDNVLTVLFKRYFIKGMENEVIVYDGNNKRLLNLFLASMRLEGKAEDSLKQYNRAIEMMMDEIGKPLADITTNDIRYHLSMYQSTGVSKVTVDNKRRYLSTFFSWLTEEEYICKNPMLRIKKVKQDKIIKKPFSDNDLERIREVVDRQRDKALIEFLLSTGCRVSEVVHLEIENVDMVKGECIVLGKGNKERKVYISERCMYHLSKYLCSRNDDNRALFLNYHGKKLSKESIELLLTRIGKAASVDNVHPHRFRRTFATNALKRGMPLQHVQRLMGHKSLDTTMLYCSLDDDYIKLEHRKIA